MTDDENFNSHAHVERDFKLRAKCNSVCYFNSHAHVERDFGGVLCVVHLGNFNSHAHVERDAFFHTFKCHNVISTHTLTWSVTSSSPSDFCRLSFQLTRSRGAWPCDYSIPCYLVNFNSHAHVERDRQYLLQYNQCHISTHTLTWSVTLEVW